MVAGVDARTPLKGLGTQRITIDATAGGLALTVPLGATLALIRSKAQAICFTDDGVTAPTSSVGMELAAEEMIWYNGNLNQFKAIRRDGSSATLLVNYYTVA